MTNKLIVVSFLFVSLICFSQESASSPYSAYGIGEIKFHGTIESRTMGGISMMPDSTRINFQNPASFGNLKYTNFAVGVSTDTKTQMTSTASSVARRTSLDYISVGIPLGKFGAAFGIIPLSSVGYRVKNSPLVATENAFSATGSGGLNSVFFGTGYRILPNLSVGATANYNFGKIRTSYIESIQSTPVGTRKLLNNDLAGFNFNFGLMYQYKLKEKLTLFSSLNYTTDSALKSNVETSIETVVGDGNLNYILVDSQAPEFSKFDFNLPEKWSVGVGISDNKKWAVGFDFSQQDRSREVNSIKPTAAISYNKYHRYGLGGYFQPKSNYYSNYFKKISYRGGFVYENTGLLVNATAIEDMAFTLGFGLPVSGSLSNFNLGLQFGKRGTTTGGLVQENYMMLNLGLSFNDKWFVKSKYR